MHAIFRHDYPLAVEPASTPRPLVQKKKSLRDSLPIDMLLSIVSVLVVAQSSLEFPEGLMNNPVLLRVKEKRNILHEISKRKTNCIDHILSRNFLLQRVIERKIKRGIELRVRRGRRRRKLLYDLKKRRGYSHLKEEALDGTMALCGELALEEALDLS